MIDRLKKLLPGSLSARLLAIFLLTVIAAVVLMASLFSQGLGSQWQRAIAPHLVQYVSYLRADLGSPPDEQSAQALAQRLPVNIQVHKPGYPTPLFSTQTQPIDISKLRFFTPRPWREHKGSPPSLIGQHIREIAINENSRYPVLRFRQGNNDVYMEFAGRPSRDRGLGEPLIALTGLALLLGLCFLSIRQLLKPIARLQNTVQKISHGDLSARSRETGRSDLAILAQSVDRMSERIEQMLNAKRELLLAISHELRSPLTRAKLATELIDNTRYQQKIIDNLNEMEALIAQLVESERLQEHAVLTLQTVDLNALISDTISHIETGTEPLPSNTNTQQYAIAEVLHYQTLNRSTAPDNNAFMLRADTVRLALMLRNILNNALLHGLNVQNTMHEPPETDTHDGRIDITLESTDEHLQIRVMDNGPGIAAQHLSSVTDAFYRTDASRTRKTGGFGLGLYLCRRIAEAHGGSLHITSPVEEGRGTQISVMLPR